MGFKRFLKKTLNPLYYPVNLVEKVIEHGVIDGIKEQYKEDILEDLPITSNIYNMGKTKGKEEGYEQASYEYEEKLLKQANEFLKQKEKLEGVNKEKDELLNEYEKYIEEKEARIHELTNEQLKYYKMIYEMRGKLLSDK